jgi:hypothetical protein
MAKHKLMSFPEFEAFIAKNEWISNDTFDHDESPDHPWFRVDSAAIAQALENASTTVLNALRTVPRDDVELRHLERNALDLRRVSHKSPKKIFFMGSAGVGKSSIFNALFNKPGLAKTGAKGDACTAVVVRYSAAAQESAEGFNVTINFLSPATIKEFITAHSKVYFQRHFSTPDPDSFESDVESSELKQVETARKFFSLVFGEGDEFKKYFTPRTFQDGSFQDLCLEKSLTKLTEIGVDHQIFTKQQYFRDAEELRSTIEGFMTDLKDGECCWHLVDSIEIRCPFAILRHNLELVDSPGKQTRLHCEFSKAVNWAVLLWPGYLRRSLGFEKPTLLAPKHRARRDSRGLATGYALVLLH